MNKLHPGDMVSVLCGQGSVMAEVLLTHNEMFYDGALRRCTLFHNIHGVLKSSNIYFTFFQSSPKKSSSVSSPLSHPFCSGLPGRLVRHQAHPSSARPPVSGTIAEAAQHAGPGAATSTAGEWVAGLTGSTTKQQFCRSFPVSVHGGCCRCGQKARHIFTRDGEPAGSTPRFAPDLSHDLAK